MTTVVIFKSKDSYKGFTCAGHAEFAEAGKDIVCASISVLVINTLNAIEQFANEQTDVTAEDGVIECRFQNDINDKTKLLMDTMLLGLKDIEKNYGKQNKKCFFRLTIEELS